MRRLTLLLALVTLIASPTMAAEYEGGRLAIIFEAPLGTAADKALPIATPAVSNIEYSNLATYLNASFLNGGAALQGTNTITRLVADDITPTGAHAGIDVMQFKFTMVNLNPAAVTFRPRIRFWFADGAGGGPGTYYNQPVAVGFTFVPLTMNANSLVLVAAPLSAGLFTMPGVRFWAGITFDNSDGTTGATAAQLNNLGQGIFGPPTVGTSADQYFLTQAAGSFFNVANPAGSLAGLINPPANFGWEFTVDAPVAVQDAGWGAIKRLYR